MSFSKPTLTIGYFYPDQLNLYGDNGNVEVLTYRAKQRGFGVTVLRIGLATQLDADIMAHLNVVFMGGGPDSEQKLIYKDLLENKGAPLKNYIDSGGVGLFVCGAYQLLGSSYKAADGTVLKGIGALDFYTEHFGNKKPRCIGNTVAELAPVLEANPLFKRINHSDNCIVGFENHGGRTYLAKTLSPLAYIKKGYGNNGEDKGEGLVYKNTLGTYFHGPFLAMNPHVADYLLAKALNLHDLTELNDTYALEAHVTAQSLKQ